MCVLAAFAGSAAPAHAASEFLALPNPAVPTPPSITATDPTQSGALGFGAAAPGTCAAPVTAEPPADSNPRHFDRYRLTNRTDQAQCVTVALDPRSCTSSPDRLQSAAYVPLFTPTAIAGSAFRSDIGEPGAPASYSFLVPPRSPFDVVVNGLGTGGLCAAYGLKLSSDRPWAKALPAITGAAVTGETLSAAGEWGTPAPRISRRWQRCDAAGANCVDVPGRTIGSYPGATSGHYDVGPADVGRTIRVLETATDAGNSTLSSTAVSVATVPVQSGRPRPAYTRTVPSSSSAIERGADLLPGSRADDATADLPLPFPVSFYGMDYTSAKVSTNGVLQLNSNNPQHNNSSTLPTTQFGPAIMAHWDDLVTTGAGEGIFTSVTGSAPNRELHVEWRASLHPQTGTGPVNFEIRLREGSPRLSLVYGGVSNQGARATVGLQAAPASPFADQISFALPQGLQIDYASSRPAIAGAPREGAALTGTDAQWIGPGTITTALQWLACDEQGGGCSEIAGATDASLTPAAAQVGRRLRLRSTATNERGSTVLQSEPSGPVASAEPTAPRPDKTAPVIRSFKVSNKTFRVARGVTPIGAAKRKKAKRGTNVESRLSEPGTARYSIQRELRGRMSGKACVRSRPRLRKNRRCRRYRPLQTITRRVGQGRNVFWFTGRLGSLALPPERYRVVMRVADAAGNVSLPRWTRFRIVAR